MFFFRRTLTLFLILSLLGADAAPALAAAGSVPVAPEKQEEAIPPFPEDANAAPVDWSAIDWDRRVTLPDEESAYTKQLQDLAARQDTRALARLVRPQEPMYSDRIMAVYEVPEDVQQLVRQYRIDLQKEALSPEQKKERKKNLTDDLKGLLVRTGRLTDQHIQEKPTVEPEVLEQKKTAQQPETAARLDDLSRYARIDLSKKEPVSGSISTVQEDSRLPETTIKKLETLPEPKNSLKAATLESMREKHLETPVREVGLLLYDDHARVTRISEAIRELFGIAGAHAGKPLMENYPGIEKNPVDRILLWLSEQQEPDGGLRGTDRYMMSAETALLLSEARLMDNDQYSALVNYLKNAEATTLRESAMKARVLFSLKDSTYEQILSDVVKDQRSDGGFGLTSQHTSDVLTTLEVVWALWGTGYYKKDAQPLAKALLFAALNVDKNGAVRFTASGPASPYLVARMLKYFVCFESFKISAVTGQGEEIDISMRDKTTAMLQFLKAAIDPTTGALSGSQMIADSAHVLTAFQHYNFEPALQKVLESAILKEQQNNGSLQDSLQSTVAALDALTRPDFAITSIAQVPGPIMQIGSITTDGSLTVGTMGKFDVYFKNIGRSRGTPARISAFVDGVLLDGNNPIEVPRPLWPGESMVVGYSMPISMAFTGEPKFKFFVEAAEPESQTENNWKEASFPVTDPEDRPALPRYFVTQKWQLGHDDNPESPLNLIPKGVRVPAFMINYRKKKVDSKRKNIVVLHRPKGATEVGRDSDGKPIPWYQDHIPDKYDGFFLGSFQEPYLPEDAEFEVKVGVSDFNNKVHIPGGDPIIIKLTSDENKYLGTVSGLVTVDSNPTAGVYLRGNGIGQQTLEQGRYSVSLPNGSAGIWADRLTSPWLEDLVTVARVPNGGEEKDVRVFTRMRPDADPPIVDKAFVMPQFPESEIKSMRVVTAVATARDAVYVKSATFWYWDPNAKDWVFLVSKDAPFSRDGLPVDIMHKWYIPETMVGSGYKIKAVVTDYSGNVSQTVESAEFEIKDGAPPKDVTPPTIGSLELRYMQGEKIKNQQDAMIIASAADDNQVVSGEFSYWDPKTNAWTAIGSSQGQWGTQWITWKIPKELLGPGYKIKAVVTDDSNNRSEEKEFGPFEIIDGSKPWGTVTVEGLTDGKWVLGGTKKITWNLKSANPIKTIDAVRLYYDGPDYWKPEHLKSSIDLAAQTSFEYTMRLQASLEGRGKIQIFFCDTAWNCTTVDSPEFEIVDPSPARQYPWNKERVFDLSRTKYPLYRLLNGTFHNADGSREYVYTEYDSSDDGKQYIRIMYRKLSGGGWQDPVPLVQDFYQNGVDERITIDNVHAVQDAAGEIHVDFARSIGNDWKKTLDNYEVFYLRVKNGAVQERTQVSSDDTNSGRQQLIADVQGNVVMAWVEGFSQTRGEGLNQIKIRTKRNGTWGSVSSLTDGTWASYPALSLDGDRAAILYVQDGDYYLRRTIDGNWNSWTRSVPITARTVPKSDFSSVLDGPDKLSSIVDPDPTDERLYRWKSSLKTKRDLETAVSGFQSKDAIVSIWSENQYTRNAYDQQLFSPQPGVYDWFARKTTQAEGWRYHLRYMRATPNFATGEVSLDADRRLVDADGKLGKEVRSFRVLPDRDGLYNVFYIYLLPVPWGQITHPYHFYFDGATMVHHAMAASPLRYVSDSINAVSERDDKLTYHFGDGQYVNTADYSAIKKYRLSLASPSNKAKLEQASAKLSWQLSGGEAESYSLLLGTDPEKLSASAEGILKQETTLDGLSGDTTYFWQVQARKGELVVSSEIREFKTPPAAPKVQVEDDKGPLDLSAAFEFPASTVGVSSERTLLIRNLGNAVLTIGGGSGVRLEGDGAEHFSIAKQPDASVDGGKATTLTLGYKPLASGSHSAVLVIPTNDSGGAEIRVKISSSAIAPKMSLVINGADTPLGSTRGLGDITTGTVLDIPVTIKNTGDANLELLKPKTGISDGDLGGTGSDISLIQFSGVGSGYARVISEPPTPIAPGGESTFTVQFVPKKRGDVSFSLGFAHNDKKIANPATMNFSARAVESDIVLSRDGTPLTSPRVSIGRLRLDDIPVGETRSIAVQVLNKGSAQLEFTTSIVGDAHDGEVTFEEDKTMPIPLVFPRPDWTYVLTIAPKIGGLKSFGIRVASNDPDQPEVGFDVAVNAPNPEIRLLADSKEVQNNSAIPLGEVLVGAKKERSFEIENVGDTELRFNDTPPIVIGGPDAQECTASVPDKSVLQKGEKTAFTVSYSPLQSKNSAVCTFTIKNNDRDEGTFVLTLTAAARDPELDVLYDDAAVPSGGSVILGETGIGVPLERTFAIKNSGDAPLRLNGAAPYVAVEGVDAGAFVVSSSVKEGVLDPGKTAVITVRFTSANRGDKTAKLILESNDRDEGRYEITLTAGAHDPDLAASKDSTSLAAGALVSFGDVAMSSKSEQTITIANGGDRDLVFEGSAPYAALSGGDATHFSVDASKLPQRVKAGESATMIISFAPTSAGSKTATLTLKSNSRSVPVFAIALSGTGTVPKAEISYGGATLSGGVLVSGPTVNVGQQGLMTFTVKSAGTADLLISGPPRVAISGADANDFSLTKEPLTPLAPGTETVFTITFAPTTPGKKEATLTVITNDRETSTLSLPISATAIKPELALFAKGQQMKAPFVLDLGAVSFWQETRLDIIVKNTGTAQLDLTGQPDTVALSGDQKDEFSVVSTPARLIAPNATSTLSLTLRPASRGKKSATITIPNSDPDQGTVTIRVGATVVAPLFGVAHDGKNLSSGDQVPLGSVEIGSMSTSTVEISNTGNGDLLFSESDPPALSGADASDFAIVSAPKKIAAGASEQLVVSFRPKKHGVKHATLTLATNDSSRSPFTLEISGTGIAPKADFSFSGSHVESGAELSGPEVLVGQSATVIIGLKNTGDARLLISGPPRVALSGDAAGEFAVETEPETPLAPGSETLFSLTLKPKTFGSKTARLTLLTNDPAAASVSFNLAYEALPHGAGTGLTAEYFGDSTLSSLVYRTRDPKIDFDWKDGSPSPDLYKNDFSVQWSGEVEPQYTGRYEFVTRADDGIRVTVNGKKIIDDWSEHSLKENRGGVDLIQGKRVPITVEFFEGTGDASARLSWKTPKGVEEVIPQSQFTPTDKPDLIPAPVGTGKGLTAEYFADPDLKLLAIRRTDPTVNFRWDFGAPDEILPSSGFSARWKGRVTPRYSGQYSFTTKSDDGVRLRIDGKQIIDDWNKRPTNKAETRTANVNLEKGKAVDITLEYFDDTGYATSRLYWKTPTGIEEIVPQSQLEPTDAADVIPSPLGTGTGLTGEYFNDTEFKAMVLRRTDPKVQFTWKYDAPHPDLPQSGFSVRWSGEIEPRYTGTYTFTTKSDEGVRLRVNNSSVIDTWGTKEQNKTLVNTGTIALEKGKKVPIELSYMDDGGYATMRLLWDTPYGVSEVIPPQQLYPSERAEVIPTAKGTGTGLTGEYFKDATLTESAFTRVDPTINFRWEFGSPDARLGADKYSVRWTGVLEPRYTGTYTFTTKTDDGVRLTVDGKKVIDDWNSRPLKTNTGTVDLVAGTKVPVMMEYFEDTGYATARLYWTTPYGVTDFVPQSQLYPH